MRIGKMIKFDLVSINNWLENLEEEQARKSVFYQENKGKSAIIYIGAKPLYPMS